MISAADIIYENHLKKAYSVKDEQKHLAITDTSCYHLSVETAWLIKGLPDSGAQELYFNSLSGLGLNEPQKIFNKLVSLGALRKKEKRSWKDLFRMFLAPSIKLLSAQVQEKFFKIFMAGPVAINKVTQFLATLSIIGLLWGTLLLITGPEKAIPVPLAGKASGFVVCLLIILGSLIHELGHSFAAMSSGIGFRPIGFSIYLIYPVFYTNVSGIEKVGLARKILIDCGGFVFQGAFLFLLLLVCSFTGDIAFAEAARWIMVIVFFNLNPLFRTDGYWLYKDVYTEFKAKRWARGLHYFYLAAFVAFSFYFLWRIGGSLGNVWHGLNTLIHSPEYLFSGGYRILFGAYFIFIGLAGGLRRFQEGRVEWMELRGGNISVTPEPAN
ncbi:MAG: hypothetical protein A2X35_07740 [Elusimicrobia bacterium GWA2_61_42]|nr:MAG: hypothetical protein A2X35_07740 [Elusimicrobia bacterium GWA2_61_42]